MSALPGGSADKAGNQYESWWTCLRAADVLDGTASSIRVEPIGTLGTGAEFTITDPTGTRAEQTKDSTKSWTVNRLIADGVLTAARGHVEDGRRFRLVCSTTSALAGLCFRAAKSEMIEELYEALNADQAADLRRIVDHWDVTPERAREVLRGTDVVHHSTDSMRQLVHTRLQLLFSDDPDVVVATLGSYLIDNLQQTLTARGIWAHLESKGLHRRQLVGDQNTVDQLHKTVQRQQSRVDAGAPNVGLVPRPDVGALVERLYDPDGEQVIVLDGRAGYGKSTVVAQVAAELERAGWSVAVARMDGVEVATNTANKLGVSIGLSETPVVLLAGVAGNEPALLIIDQLDAVSAYSGRMPDKFEAVAEILRELDGTPNVKALLVVRTVDLEADSRLRRLIAKPSGVGRHTLGLLPLDDVKALLLVAGVTVPTRTETLELLRTPLHLSVFSRLSGDGQAVGYKTLQELYDQYTTEARSRVTERIGTFDWQLITSTMVTHMSDHEMLVAPSALLDAVDPGHLQALVSEAVLSVDAGTYGFFHESYFDYLFARSFIAAGRGLHEFLASSGQVLFRRAQTRQILEHLAATDRDQFRRTVVELLGSPQIRFHIKAVVVDMLGQYNPTGADWQALEPIAFADENQAIGQRVRQLLAGANWFDAADQLDRWEQWLGDPNRLDQVFNPFALVARLRPHRVAELLRLHVGESEDWRARTRWLIEWSINPGLTDLIVELLAAGALDDASGRVAMNSSFWSLVHALHNDSPTDAIRVTGAHLRRALARAQVDGSDDPFEAGILDTNVQGGSVLHELSDADPASFVAEVFDFVVTVAQANQHEREHLLPAGRRWALRHIDTDYTVDDDLFNALDAALRALAARDPALVQDALAELSDIESEELRFLACRTLTVSGPADVAIGWLLRDPRNLVLGWSGSPRWASRELVEAWGPTCSNDFYGALEAAVLGYTNPFESRAGVGNGQYELLTALPVDRMSADAARRLRELTRRFDNRKPNPPTPIEASFVGPPIGDQASEKMSDENWLQALAKHNSDKTNWDGDRPVGGARELASVLGRRSKEDPARFARLSLRFDHKIPAVAIGEVIRNLPGELDPDLLGDVCEHARALHNEHVGRDICWAIAKTTEPTRRLAELVAQCSTDSDPDRELARTPAGSGDQNYYGGDLHMAGINSTRGGAAGAAAHILFLTGDHTDTLRPVVQALVNDPILGVRTCAAEAVGAMLNHEPAFGLDLGEQLFDALIDVLDAHPTARLLTYLVQRAPERFAAILAAGLEAADSIATRAGQVWVIAVLGDALGPDLPTEVAALRPAARRGAAEVLAANVEDAQAPLLGLFDDEDDETRRHAARAMRHLDELGDADVETMVLGFMDSRSFAEHFEDLVDALEHMTATMPEVAIEVCEKAVAAAGTDIADVRTARAMVGSQITTIVLRLYRQAKPGLRSRCLDLIDKLTEVAAYGVAEALSEER